LTDYVDEHGRTISKDAFDPSVLDTAIHDNIAKEIRAIDEKTSISTTDIIIIEDSKNEYKKKKVQIANLPEAGVPSAHKDTHDPNDGSDPVDTSAAAEISIVKAAGTGTSHDLARADHVHAINHAITDNHIATYDGTQNSGETVRMTANGLESRTDAEMKTQLGYMTDLAGDVPITRELVAGASLVAGNWCYMGTGGKMLKTNATAYATVKGLVALCLDTLSDTQTGTFQLFGKWTTSGLTAGSEYVLEAVAGTIATQGTLSATEFQRKIGSAESTTVLFVNCLNMTVVKVA